MKTHARQQGAVLMVSLVMLLILTVIAITAANMSTLQLRMANNSQLQNIAFQAAESGIRHGQQDITTSGQSGVLNYETGTTTAGISPRYESTTVILLEPGSSLDASGEGGGTSLERYQVRITADGKACEASDTNCNPTVTTDNRPRARHLLGCRVQAVVAPLCKQGN